MLAAADAIFISPSDIPVFVEAPRAANPRNTRVEYFITPERSVKLHLWPDPKFPPNMEAAMRQAYDPRDVQYRARFDFVPEVNSWFLELSGFALQLTPELVHSLLGRLRDRVG